MFHSLCLMVENFKICILRTGSPKKFADLRMNLKIFKISDFKFVDSHTSEICRFAIAD